MKKFFKIAGIVVAVLVVILLIIPFFVNVEKFRPEIEQKAGEALNSKVSLGKLGMRLIPSLSIYADKVSVVPNDPRFPEPIVKSDYFKISIPLLSLLGSPSATLRMDKPEIFIVQRENKFNFETLTNSSKEKAKEAVATKSEGASSSYLMNKIQTATLTVDVTGAKLTYKTPTDNVAMTIDEMLLKNLGYNSPIEVKILSAVDYKGESGEVRGPFEFSGDIRSQKNGDEMGATFAVVGDFSKMLIKTGATFHKPEKTPLKFEMKGDFKKGATTDVHVTDLNFQLASFTLAGNLSANNIGNRDQGSVDIDIRNKSSKLEDLSDLSPLLADYQLKGELGFYAKVKGSLKNPALDIMVKADDLKGKTPKLSLPINHLKVTLKVTGTLEDPIVELDPADLLIGKSDVRIYLKAAGLKAPQVKFNLQSKSLDLAFLSTGKESTAAKGEAKAEKGKPLDAALEEMAPTVENALKNKMLDRAKVDFSLHIGELKLEGARLNEVTLAAVLAARQFKISQGSINGYGGNVKLAGASQLNPSAPTYDYNLKLQNIDLAQVIAAHAPAWKGQLSGILNATSSVNGAGLRKEQIAKNLKGGMKGEILKGNTSLQVSKIVSTVLDKLPQKPNLKKSATDSSTFKGRFKTLKMDSKIVGRRIDFNTLDINFEPDELAIGELEFKADGSLTFDRSVNLRGIAYLNPQQVHWPEGVGKSGKIEVPLAISGPMDDAKPDIGYTVSKMGTQLLKNTVQKEAKKGIENLLKGKNPGDLLKGIFK